MPGFIWWLTIGLVAGGMARLLVPGRQPMGLWLTIVLGLAGSLMGGFVSALVFGYDALLPGLQASGLVMSIVGAVIALSLFDSYSWRRAE